MNRICIPKTGPRKSDKYIPWYFVAFFLVVFAVDGFFVYKALKTHSGVVTEHAYEAGIAFNRTLDKAREQRLSGVQSKASYKDGVLIWDLKDADGRSLEEAIVTARIIRPVQDGYDFDINMPYDGSGLFKATLKTPLPGQWTAKLNAVWNNTQTYQTNLSFIVR